MASCCQYYLYISAAGCSWLSGLGAPEQAWWRFSEQLTVETVGLVRWMETGAWQQKEYLKRWVSDKDRFLYRLGGAVSNWWWLDAQRAAQGGLGGSGPLAEKNVASTSYSKRTVTNLPEKKKKERGRRLRSLFCLNEALPGEAAEK